MASSFLRPSWAACEVQLLEARLPFTHICRLLPAEIAPAIVLHGFTDLNPRNPCNLWLIMPVNARRVAVASAIGTTMEWYDFSFRRALVVFAHPTVETPNDLVSIFLIVSRSKPFGID
jgi:hypothetical protein